jgi:hypothetical protein
VIKEEAMYFYRIIVGSISLSILFTLYSVGTGGREERSDVKSVTVPCFSDAIMVDPNSGVDPSKETVFVCKDDILTWDGQGHKFKVSFKQTECPFTDNCKGPIDDKHVHSAPVRDIANLSTFKYKIKVDNGKWWDPHVVGGGHRPPYSAAAQ